MPLIEPSSYTPPLFLRNGNLLTMWGGKIRRPTLRWEPFFTSFRLNMPDGDFFDVDYLPAHHGNLSDKLAILSHGLEGNSRRTYMRCMAEVFRKAGWDVFARNFRGCSGEENRTAGMYHSGQTEDLHHTVMYGISRGYKRIVLVGFSMGGNQTLRYLGEDPGRVPTCVAAGVGISVPCDLEGAAKLLDLPSRRIYMEYFMHTLRRKMRAKAKRFPELFNISGLARIHTFSEFDNRYTAPLHGFASAEDYYRRTSCVSVLHNIRVPTLLLNAADDPFLSPGCYPREFAAGSPLFTLEIPAHGGHVGFVGPDPDCYWSEKRTIEFVETI